MKHTLWLLFFVCSLALGADTGWYAGAGWGPHHWNKGGSKYGVFGGYQLTSNWGAEVGLTDVGIAEGVEVSGVFSYPVIKNLDVYAKAGAFINVHTLTDPSLIYGLGASYKLTKSVGLRGQVQRYVDVGGKDLNALTGAVVFKF